MHDSPVKLLDPPPRYVVKILTGMYVGISLVLLGWWSFSVLRIYGIWADVYLMSPRTMLAFLSGQLLLMALVFALDGLAREHGEKIKTPIRIFVVFKLMSLPVLVLNAYSVG
jgi:hypothetical protein